MVTDATREKLDTENWDRCDGFGLQYTKPERQQLGNFLAWTLDGAVTSPQIWRETPWLIEAAWRAHWGVFASDAGLHEQEVLRHLLEFARLTVDDYGYLFYMRRRCGPQVYHMGMSVGGDGRNDEQKNNVGGWHSDVEHFKRPLLRDVYPYNFLTRRYLDLPVHGTTLEGWISADPARGTLEPLTDRVTTWRPVVENIPVIREALFRAGVMFYWRFYVHPSDTYLHMPGPRPFGADEPIPEIFRAEFYAGRDPGITL